MGYDPSHHDSCVRGIAEILWGCAWADHVEAHRCTNLSGCDILQVMPPIPRQAWAVAERVLGHIEQANPQWSHSWRAMFAAARRADGLPDEGWSEEEVTRFGNCLAYMAMGHGVSWFDDHEHFPLSVPLCAEDSELELLAGDRCRRKGRKRCVACAGYLDEEGRCNGCSQGWSKE